MRLLIEHYAMPLSALGIAGIAVFNWKLWRRDRVFTEQVRIDQPPAPLANTPRVSVLVAAWNEQHRIEEHVRSFLALRYPNIELILCAGGADATFERARSYAGDRVTVLLQQPGEGKQRSLARCYAQASGDILFFTDADCTYDDQALTALITPLINGAELVTTGTSRPLKEQTDRLLPRYLWASDVASSSHRPQYSEGLLGRNAALTRSAIDTIGGLDFDAPTGTDYQLARRLRAHHINIRYVVASAVPTEFPQSVRAYRRQQSRWLRNLLIYGYRTKSWSDVRPTVQTIITGLVMCLLPFSALLAGRLPLIVWSMLISHATFSKLRYVCFAARLNRHRVSKRLIGALLPLTLIDGAIWASPLVDLLFPKRRHRW